MARKTIGSVCALSLCALVLAPGTAGAANIPVTTFDDITLNDAFCSLREAIKSAEDNSNLHEPDCIAGEDSPDQDAISLPAGTYTLAGAGGEDANLSGDLDITTADDHVSIEGTVNAQEVPTSIIDAINLDRIFDVQDHGLAVPVFNVQDVELRNGSVSGGGPAGDGGAIRILENETQFTLDRVRIVNSDAGRYGGAVSFDGASVGPQFTVEQSEFSGNTAMDDGGAIYYSVTGAFDMTVATSAFVDNSSGGAGGGLYAIGNDNTLTMRNTTLSGNSAAGGGGGIGFGAAALSGDVFFSTIAGNTATAAGQGGGVQTDLDSQALDFVGTILSGNLAGGSVVNCDEVDTPSSDGVFTASDSGYNLENANTCTFNTATPDFSLINTNPLLAPIATNVGTAGSATTRTHGLYDTSPALNRVPRSPADMWCDNFHTNGQDQRFQMRPPGPGGMCDVGAFEGSVGPAPPPPPVITPVIPLTPATPTAPAPTKKKKCKKKKRGAAAAKKCKKKK